MAERRGSLLSKLLGIAALLIIVAILGFLVTYGSRLIYMDSDAAPVDHVGTFNELALS